MSDKLCQGKIIHRKAGAARAAMRRAQVEGRADLGAKVYHQEITEGGRAKHDAIVGAVRIDLFTGWGEPALTLASRMKQPLRAWVLWPRRRGD